MSNVAERPAPHEVFTPGAVPLATNNVYARRLESERKLTKNLQRNLVPLVYGEYGVGKTTVVQKFLSENRPQQSTIYIASVANQTLGDVFKVILERLDYSVVVEEQAVESVSMHAGFDLKIFRAGGEGGVNDTTVRQFVVTSPTDSRLNELIRSHNLTVVLDEMHRATDEFRSQLGDWIKATRTGGGDFSLVLIGTSMDAERLVTPDPGIDRYVKEMQVPILTEDEAKYIVKTGFAKLGIEISDVLTDRLVLTASGAPTIVQTLCLDVAESVVDRDSDTVSEMDLKSAVESYLDEHGKRLLGAYSRAIETTGPKRYRKQILNAIAGLENDYATMEDIREAVSASLGEDTPSTALSGPLRSLKEDDYGKVLQDVERLVGTTRVYNLTTFSDPMMKSFVRFMVNIETSGLSPSDEQLTRLATTGRDA